MKRNEKRMGVRRSDESGQAIALVMLALGLFLLGALAFSVDLTNVWFQRQSTQVAADSACTAAAMDLLIDAQGGATGNQGFTTTSAFNCTPSSAAMPCVYARRNGYSSDTTNSLVSVSFPATVPGVTPPPGTLAPTAFVNVVVTSNVPPGFWGMLGKTSRTPVRSSATCGLVLAKAPIPILVLNPTVSASLHGSGTPTIKIFGGSDQSIEVNSNSGTAAQFGGTIDLSKGGPNHTGSDFGTFGGPASPTGTFLPGTTGHWRDPSAPIADPFATTAAPTQPATPGTITHRLHGVNGCPNILNGCDEYTPGNYPTGISVGPGGATSGTTAIFDPGVYYVTGGMQLKSNSTVRPAFGASVPDPTGMRGTIFYLTGTFPNCSGSPGALCVDANSGNRSSTLVDSLNTSIVQCPGGDPPDPPLPATLNGNILLAPCAGTYGDPLGKNRGILFFLDRRTNGTGQWGGSGQFLLAGTLYFHQCNSTKVGDPTSGEKCATTGAFNAQIKPNGNPGSSTYILGEIIADEIDMSGTPVISMQLNPNSAYNTIKATLLR